jgi:tetratricopeptide (TPR) repeat protein
MRRTNGRRTPSLMPWMVVLTLLAMSGLVLPAQAEENVVPPPTSPTVEQKTAGPCSPTMQGIDGNAHNNCIIIGWTATQVLELVAAVIAGEAPDASNLEKLRKELAVAETALLRFLEILGEKQVPPDHLVAQLEDIAMRHLRLLTQVGELNTDNSEIKLLVEQARTAINLGEYDDAEQFLIQAEDMYLAMARSVQQSSVELQKTSDQYALDGARVRAQRAEMHFLELEYSRAAEIYVDAAEIVPHSHNKIRAKYVHRAGISALYAGEYLTASAHLDRAIKIKIDEFGDFHPELTPSLDALAQVYIRQERYDEAMPLLQRSWKILVSQYGPGDFRVGKVLNSLGILYHKAGEHEGAEWFYRSARYILLTTMGGVLRQGPTLEMAVVEENLAGLFRKQGRCDEAKKHYGYALAFKKKFLAPDSRSIAFTLERIQEDCNTPGGSADRR